jgi:hypothetical protein
MYLGETPQEKTDDITSVAPSTTSSSDKYLRVGGMVISYKIIIGTLLGGSALLLLFFILKPKKKSKWYKVRGEWYKRD